MNFGANLLQYVNRMKISQKELAKRVQENEKTISSYITGKSYPTYKKLIKICNLLQCDPNTLMEGDFEIASDELAQQRQQILSAYQDLSSNPDKKEIVDFILGIGEYDTSNMVKPNPAPIYRFPVFDQEAAAGVGVLNNSDNYDIEEYQVDNIPDNAVFAMKIKGDSMYDEEKGHIKDKATVLVNPKDTDFEGKIVIANLDGECVCKRYTTIEDHVEFKSDNELRQDENKDSRNYREPKVIGVVLGVIEDEKFIPVK